MVPYEYHNDRLGVQARFIFKGKNADERSLQLIGERGLQKRIEKGQLHRLRANGPNTPMLVSWLTLPPTWHRALIDAFGEPARKIKMSWFEQHYERDTSALYFFMAFRLPDSRPLDDQIIDEYTLNASVLNTVEKVYNNRKGLIRTMKGTPNALGVDENGERITAWDIVTKECIRFKDIWPHTLPTNAASLRRKLRQYKKEGYACLVHKNFGNNAARKVDKNVLSLLNSMFADRISKPTAADITRKYEGFLTGYVEVINNDTGELYNPKEYPSLSAATITNYLSDWENTAGTHAIRSGNRQVLMNKFKPYHDLKQPEYAGSIISIDDRQPPFEYDQGRRVWFYNGIDLASEALTVWVYGKTKEGIIDEFYRQLVRNYTSWGLRLPAELEAEMSLNSKFVNTFLQPGSMFSHVRIEANNARGKRIEAYFRQLRYGIEKGREGWIARPFATSEANQAGPVDVPIIPFDEIIERCLRDIEIWNNMEHSKIKGKTRWEVFIENQNPQLKETNWRGFLPHIGNYTESSCRLGMIRFNNGKYLLGENGKIAYSDQLISLMKRVEGQDVDVYWLDDNDGKVMKALVYLHGTDRYVCEAIRKPAYNRARIEQTPEDEANRTAMSKYVASVEGFVNSQKRSIDKVTVIDNRPKTLNDGFKIPGLRRTVQEMPNYEEPEVLPDQEDDDDDLTILSNGYRQSLEDRF